MAMELQLRDYVAGHVLREGMILFEDGMGPWVKREAREHFNRKLGVGPDDDAQAAAAPAAAVEVRAKRRAELMERHDELDAKLVTCAKQDKAAVKQQRKEIGAQIRELDAKNDPALPVPRWIEECRAFFGPKMKKFVCADMRWDVHTIVVVMWALLPDVFARFMPSHFHAKELLGGIQRVITLRTGRAHRVPLTESDVLEALRQMAAVLRRCGCADDKASEVESLLEHAKELVQRARHDGDGDGVVVDGPRLSAAKANAQLLFETVGAWELHVEAAMGLVKVSADGTVKAPEHTDEVGRLAYSNQTVNFGANLDGKWREVVKDIKPQFQTIAPARHWYFHNLPGDTPERPFSEVFAAMNVVIRELEKQCAVVLNVGPFRPPAAVTNNVDTTLRLQTPSVRMSVPVARVGATFVGRSNDVRAVSSSLVDGARVLIHGPPGVGKDTVMAEVAHRDEVQARGGLQAWLHASSDVVLQRQLIELFQTHRPVVVRGLDDDPAAAIAAIGRWLRANREWVLFVEDANVSSSTLWSVLPVPGAGGCVLVTSQSDLTGTPLSPTNRFKLDPISTNDSIELLRCSNAFAKKAPTLPEESSEDDLRRLCVHERAHCYIQPATYENAKALKARHRSIAVRLFEHDELSRPELRVFLEDTLGNLPLSVAQIGHIMRADPRVSGVTDLIALFKHTADLADVDRDGRNPMMDTHYYGLYLSVKISLDRLRSAVRVPGVDRYNAQTLLAVLSLLDRAQTPLELLKLQGRDGGVLAWRTIGFSCYSPACRSGKRRTACMSPRCMRRQQLVGLLLDGDALDRARALCIEYGLLQVGAVDIIGVMHQLVQKCLVHQLITGTGLSDAIVNIVRDLLGTRFRFDEGTPAEWLKLRRLEPCLLAWGSNAGLGNDAGEPKVTCGENDLALVMEVSRMLLEADGKPATAALLLESVIELGERVLPVDHSRMMTAKSNLASTYSALGRQNEALALRQEVLAIHERVLPAGDPLIAASKNEVASSFSELGRHDEALALKREVLAFNERTLPADHPRIALSKNNLATTYSALGLNNEALALQLEVFAIHKRVLPADHPHIALTKNNLAGMYNTLGRLDEAQALWQEVLAFRERVLPADHPDIATAKGNLAMTSSELGRHDEALRLKRDVLAFREQVLPADHPDIALSKNNLAATYSALGRHDDALALQLEVLVSYERVLPADHPDIAVVKGNLATKYYKLGKHDEALVLYKEVLAFQERVLPADNPKIATTKNNLAAVYNALGRHDEALPLMREVLAFRERVLPADHPDTALVKGNLASMCSALGRLDEALALEVEVLAFRERVLPAGHPHIALAKGSLAGTMFKFGRDRDAAVRHMAECVQALVRAGVPANHEHMVRSRDALALMRRIVANDARRLESTSRPVYYGPSPPPQSTPEEDRRCPCASGNYKQCFVHL